jgi:C-terminal processing protease CtpA/Prc
LRVTPVSAKSPAHLISATEALHLPTPFYRKHPDAWYWYEYLPDMQTVYIQYSRCRNDPKKSFKDFAKGLFRFVDGLRAAQRIERVIVDLRFNSGGDSSVIDPLVEGLQARTQLSDKGRLYVLISRSTFSSGMMAAVRLREDLDAILLGEGSGSPPNEYGEVKSFSLPNSKIEIQYTTKYFRLLENSDPPTLEPDVAIQRSTTDFLQGRDQILDTALQYHRPIVQPAASK